MTLGDKIKKYRLLYNIKQKELGSSLGFKLSTSEVCINQYENNKMTSKADIRARMAEILDIDIETLSNIGANSEIENHFVTYDKADADKDITNIKKKIKAGAKIQAEIKVAPDYFSGASLVFFNNDTEVTSECKLELIGGAWSEITWFKLFLFNKLLDEYYLPYIEEKCNITILSRDLYNKWLYKTLDDINLYTPYKDDILTIYKKYCKR